MIPAAPPHSFLFLHQKKRYLKNRAVEELSTMAGAAPAITSSSNNSRGGGLPSGTATTTATATSLSDDGSSIGDAETVTMSNLSFRWSNNTKVKPAAIPKQIVPSVVVPEVRVCLVLSLVRSLFLSLTRRRRRRHSFTPTTGDVPHGAATEYVLLREDREV
jgi:hypothetical protein